MRKDIIQNFAEVLFAGRRFAKNIKLKGAATTLGTLPKRMRIQHIVNYCREHEYTKVGSLSCVRYLTDEPTAWDDRFSGDKKVVNPGDKWAEKTFDCGWLHVTGKIPTGFSADEIVFVVDVAGEGLVYDKDGLPRQGITTHVSTFDYSLGFPGKTVVYPDGLTDGENVEFFVDMGANDLFGRKAFGKPFIIYDLAVAIMNKEVMGLGFDLEVLIETWDINKKGDLTKQLFNGIKSALKGAFPLTEASAKVAREKLKPLLEAKNTDPNTFTYTAVGHSHLDLAWLWPIRETKRKGGRTFANQLRLLEKYPNYIFGASQAQLYVWMKEGYPELFEQVRKWYEQGRWELQGALWVEPDTNLISGESMIRQVYYGKKYFLEEFNEEMKILWLPDSFGYSACLPQVMKLADVPYFLTQKMSWNTVNKFPYHSFTWKGLDGSAVFAHMLPEETYNSPATPQRMGFGEENFRERKISNKSLSLYGIGDGGGGPGMEHLERVTRLKDLKGAPKYNTGKAIDLFNEIAGAADYPEHSGELYLERHRGTYTSQAKNKKYNRKIEFMLRNYEILLCLAREKEKAASTANNPKPQSIFEVLIDEAALETIWKEVLLYQFHDILPGSSINRVYVESQARYVEMMQQLEKASDKLLSVLFGGKKVTNFTSFDYDKITKTPDGWKNLKVPAMSAASYDRCESVSEFVAKAGADFIENDKVKVQFADGVISSIFDKTSSSEFIPQGKTANLFYVRPDVGDAWDIKPWETSKKTFAKTLSFKTGVDGAKAYAKVKYKVLETVIEQDIFITDGSQLITFDTLINHQGQSRALRVMLPQSVKAEKCKFNIQFGHIERSMLSDTSVTKAQFEVSAQKFLDISDKDRGISLINDCKYGYRVKDGVFDIDVIRSPNPRKGPSTEIDQGENRLVYALYPHSGPLSKDTYKEAYFLNNPLKFTDENSENSAENSLNMLLSTDNENIVIEAIKQSDDSSGFVARIYNCSEAPATATLKSTVAQPTELVSIMEKPLQSFDGTITLKPFELACVKFDFAN